MNGKKVLALIMGAIIAASGMSQMAVQVYAHDEESSSSSYYYYEESSFSSEPMEDSPAVEELEELTNFKSERIKYLVQYRYLKTDLSNVYVSTSDLVFKPVSDTEAKLVCLDEEFEFDGDIVVPEMVKINGNVYSVTSIAGGAFNRCVNLKKVTLPASITRIGGGAFYFCYNLQLEQLPAGLTKIGHCAFDSCNKLKFKSLPEGLTKIGNGAFVDCTNLELKSLPKGLTTIGECTFFDCEKLQLTSLPDDIETIARGAFTKCKNLQLTSLPTGVTEIGEGAFSGCEKLKLISLPNGLREISKRAFEGTGIRTITIPASVTKLGDSAFETYSIERINLAQGSRLNSNDIKRAYGRQLEKILGPAGKEEYLRKIREKMLILIPVELNAGAPEDVCLTCGEKFNEENDEFGILSCGHYVHLECFDEQVESDLKDGKRAFICPRCELACGVY